MVEQGEENRGDDSQNEAQNVTFKIDRLSRFTAHVQRAPIGGPSTPARFTS